MASKSSVAAKLQAVGDEAFGFRIREIRELPEITFDVFMKCGQWLRAFVKSGHAFEDYKVSLSNDSHFSAAVEAAFAFSLFHLNGVSVADRQRRRSEMLHATADDLLRFADILDEILPNATRCVIGEEALVRRCGLSEFEIDKQK